MKHKKKRAIRFDEHQLILGAEKNTERRDYYELAWHTGASQGDLDILRAEDVDWRASTIRFFRKKKATVVCLRFGEAVAVILRHLPDTGLLFPQLATVRSSDRATEFGQRCGLLNITGDRVPVALYVRNDNSRAKLVKIIPQCGPMDMDDASPAITVMMPDED